MADETPKRPIGPIVRATVVTPDLAHTTSLYQQALGWQQYTELDRLDESTAHRWGAPALAGARMTLVGPGHGPTVAFVEPPAGVESARYEPLRSYGWAALEVLVADAAAAVDAAEQAGFTVLARPRRLGSGGALPLVAGQVAGPAGEGLYLTQILGDVPGFSLPDPVRSVGELFICVLGAADLEASRAVLESGYLVRRASDRRSPIGVLNRVLGLPDTTVHRLSSLQLAGRTVIEIDQYGEGARHRAAPPGALPYGLAVVTVRADVTTPQTVALPDGALLDLVPE